MPDNVRNLAALSPYMKKEFARGCNGEGAAWAKMATYLRSRIASFKSPTRNKVAYSHTHRTSTAP